MRKILSLFISCAMLFSLSATAFAAENTEGLAIGQAPIMQDAADILDNSSYTKH